METYKSATLARCKEWALSYVITKLLSGEGFGHWGRFNISKLYSRKGIMKVTGFWFDFSIFALCCRGNTISFYTGHWSHMQYSVRFIHI